MNRGVRRPLCGTALGTRRRVKGHVMGFGIAFGVLLIVAGALSLARSARVEPAVERDQLV